MKSVAVKSAPVIEPPARGTPRRAYWLKTLHQWHWISSAIALVGMLLFAVTGITLNHAVQIEATPTVVSREGELPPTLRAALAGATEGDAPLPQAVRHWIAESRAETEAARLFVRDTVQKLERVGQRQARDEISMIKYFVPRVMQNVLDRALQVHGGFGLTDATPLAHWWAHERAARIYDGPDEVHKDAVAKHTLQQYVTR